MRHPVDDPGLVVGDQHRPVSRHDNVHRPPPAPSVSVLPAHEEILDVPSAPAIPGRSTSPPLRKEFDFLAGQGKLPPEARWDAIADALRYDGLYQVLAEPRHFRLAEFDYAD